MLAVLHLFVVLRLVGVLRPFGRWLWAVLCLFFHAPVQFGLKVVSLLTCMRIDLVLGWLNSSVECSDSDARLGAFLHEVVVHGRDAPSYLRMPWFILVCGCVLIVYLLLPFLGVSWESHRMAVV